MRRPLIYLFIKMIATLLVFILFCLSASAQSKYAGIEYSLFNVPCAGSNIIVEEFTMKQHYMYGNYAGFRYTFSNKSYGCGRGCFRRSNRRYTSVSVGIGKSNISFQNELYGFFPETKQYGTITLNGSYKYLTFPVSISHNFGKKRLKFLYFPQFINSSSFEVFVFGGAIGSTYADNYKCNSRTFQHSITVSLANDFFIFHDNLLVSIDPFCGIGSGYFNFPGARTCNFNYGISISFQPKFRLPQINISIDDNDDFRKKEQELKKKQQEIENKLKKQT